MRVYWSAPRRRALINGAALAGLALVAALLVLESGPAWAAEAEKSAFQEYWALGWRIVNFLILAVVIFKVAKEPARKFFKGKRQEAEATLAQLEEAKSVAQEELGELKVKLEKADQEMDRLVEQFAEAASRDHDRMIKDAGARAEEIVAQAKIAAETELNRAVKRLTVESTRMIVARAKEMLKTTLTPADHQRLVDESLSKMSLTTMAR